MRETNQSHLPARMSGVVGHVHATRGFCFVRGEADRISRFVHARDVHPMQDFDILHEGSHVSFIPMASKKGPRAIEVQLLREDVAALMPAEE